MKQHKRSVGSSTRGAGCAKHEENPLGSKGVLLQDGDELSPHWISKMKRFFDHCGDGKATCMAAIASSRVLKFLVVGGIGVFVNLAVMGLLIQAGFAGDWRASAIATAAGALHNYLLNNHWTFSDRRRNGRALLNGAFVYLPMSAVAIAITTVSYSILSQSRFRAGFGSSSFYLLGAQLVSILVGTYFNYTLNKVFTWRLDRDQL
jgi:putative flippase GtrA